MIDVNWDLAPEGAVAVGQRKDALAFTDEDDHVFLNGHWGISMGWKTIAKRPTFAESISKTPTQTKTVADAVEAFDGRWGNSVSRYIAYNPNSDRFTYSETGEVNQRWYIVCTRAEFEAYVKEQEGEKWTHLDTDGEPCNILIDAPDSLGRVIILRRNGWYMPVDRANLKPIKPTLTKSEAWDKLHNDSKHHKNYGLTLQMLSESYDII